MKWVLVAAFISLLPVTSTVKLQLFLAESVDVTEGESVTLACSFSPPSIVSSDLYITWLTMPTRYLIYDSHLGNLWLGIAEFAGNEEKGDCSLKILNVSSNLSPVLKCHVLCTSCGKVDWQVEREVKLNVTAAAPQLHGGASGMTVAAAGETSPTADPHFRDWMGLVVAAVVVFVIVIAAAAVIFIQKCRRSSGTSPGSHNGDGQADLHGDVEENEHPLMEVN